MSHPDACVTCGHRRFRHILKQLPDHAVCMNWTCPCENYKERDIYAEIREAGRMGEEAARQKIDAPCRGCGHSYTHHNLRYAEIGGYQTVTARPCGEEDCQCDDFGFTIPAEFLDEHEKQATADIQALDDPEELRVVDDRPLAERALEAMAGAMTEELKLAGLTIPDDILQTTQAAYSQSSAVEALAEREEDGVNHPSHYQGKGPEAIEIARHLSFNLGNALKYIYRAGNKMGENPDKDLAKAIWYIEDERKLLRGEYDGDKPAE